MLLGFVKRKDFSPANGLQFRGDPVSSFAFYSAAGKNDLGEYRIPTIGDVLVVIPC